MKILKWILITIVSIVILVLVVALCVSKDYSIEREVTINKPKQQVFDYIKLLNNQQNYGTWSMQDPNMKRETEGTDGTVGYKVSWDSKKEGQGEQTITNISEGSRIDLDLHFIKPMDGKATSYMTTDSIANNQTQVKWGMKGTMSYPMNIMNLMMDKEIGGELQKGLDNLKGVLEKQ